MTDTDRAHVVRLEKDYETHIARITFDNPGKKNALPPDEFFHFGELLDDVADDDKIKVVLLRGTGGVFTTGADLSYAYNWYDTPGDDRRPSQRRRLRVDRNSQRVFHDLNGFPKATVAQVEGYALGAGFEFALGCDLAVVSRTTKIGMPAARFLGPVLGNLALFLYRLGPVVTRDLLLTGRIAEAGEFEGPRVFARFVDDGEVAETAEALAAQVAKMPADGITIAKEAWRLIESSSALSIEETTAYLFHSYGTNLRFEPDEFNFVKERAANGTTAAFKARDQHYEGGN